jgi:hypothetical protein
MLNISVLINITCFNIAKQISQLHIAILPKLGYNYYVFVGLDRLGVITQLKADCLQLLVPSF